MQSNASILSALWLEGTNDYQQRIPSPTVATQAQTAAALFTPSNANLYNQFVNGLVTRIGATYVQQQSWRNPLAAFKRGELPFGTTVQDLQVAWLKAHTYSDEAQTLLKVHRPRVRATYYEANRFDQYKISINRTELRASFVEPDGLNRLVASIMEAPISSANYDEYRQMLELMAYYDQHWGFFKIHADEPDDDTSAKGFLKSLKSMVNRLAFPSALYNAQNLQDEDGGFVVFARPEELVLFVTPEAAASVDVDALATLFHLEPADAQVRRVIVDEFPIDGAFALLTTRDWYQVYDIENSVGDFYNPETLNSSFFHTIMQVMAVSPFVPAIVWTTGAGTQTGTITQTVTTNRVDAGIYTADAYTGAQALVGTNSATVAGEDVLAGRVYIKGLKLDGTLSDGTVTGAERIGGIKVKPDAAIINVTGASASGAAIALTGGTRVNRLGKVFLQADIRRALSAGNVVLTLEALPTYRNPDGSTPTPQATTVTLTITQLADGGQPEPGPGPEPPAPTGPQFYVGSTEILEGTTPTITLPANTDEIGFRWTAGDSAYYVNPAGNIVDMAAGPSGFVATVDVSSFTPGEPYAYSSEASLDDIGHSREFSLVIASE